MRLRMSSLLLAALFTVSALAAGVASASPVASSATAPVAHLTPSASPAATVAPAPPIILDHVTPIGSDWRATALAGTAPEYLPTAARLHAVTAMGESNVASPSVPSRGSASPPPARSTAKPGPPMSSATPFAGNGQTATVVGTVENSITLRSISGALITPVPLGSNCQNSSCPFGQTNQNGQFTVTVERGSDEILVQDNYYLDNYTILTNVSAGSTINVGIIYLVPNGAATGVLEVNQTGSPRVLPGVKITGQSRDGRIIGNPYTFSGPTGAFNVTVPPGDSEVEVSQTGLCFGATIFVHLRPAQTLNLGIVYITCGVRITVNPIDVTTGKPISSSLAGNMPAVWSITATNPKTGQGFPQGNSLGIGSANYEGAPVGADLITVQAAGYITNSTYITVAPEPYGVTEKLGNVYLVPDTPVETVADLTWQSAAYASNGPVKWWGVGNYWVSDCSMDGYTFSIPIVNPLSGAINMSSSNCISSPATSGCAPPGSAELFMGAPLRNYVTVSPDTGRACNPYVSTWPIPDLLPVLGNWTWINLTAGRGVNIGAVNLTPGTYIQLNVFTNPGEQQIPSVAACSTDVTNSCMPKATWAAFQQPGVPIYCADTRVGVCVPAPPGPVVIKASIPGCPQNLTEAYVPPGSWPTTEVPLPLTVASNNHFASINVTCDNVTGIVRDSVTGGPPTGLVSLSVLPAGLANLPQGECTATSATGTYNCPAPPGWDEITATAPNYVVNRTWVYVNGPYTPVQLVNLTPDSYITGQILGPNGFALNTSSAAVCLITSSVGSCKPLSGASGLPTTAGTYWALVGSGHIPVGQYLIVGNAPGYLSNQTWVNVSYPDEVVQADTIVLEPILGSQPTSSPFRPGGASSGGGSPIVAEYVVGRIVDNTTGAGVPGATITVSSVLGGSPTVVSGAIDSDGYFNFTQALGEYWFNVTVPGFYIQASLFGNLNGSADQFNLGTVRLQSYGYLAGRIVIAPWQQVVSLDGHIGVAAAAVQVCNHQHTLCGAAGDTDTGGLFNLSAPIGKYDLIAVTGTATGVGSAQGGYMANTTYFNITDNSTQGPFVMGMVIFAAFVGNIRDASTDNASPVRFATEQLQSLSKGNFAGVGETVNGGGQFAVFLPPGNITSAIAKAGAFTENVSSLRFKMTEPEIQNYTDSRLNVLQNASLMHFGWFQANILSEPSANGAQNAQVPFATLNANVTTQNASISYATSGLSDEYGFANISAPIGSNVTIVISGADFNSTRILRVHIGESETTYLNGTGPATLGTATVVPWGWVQGVVYDPAAYTAGDGVNAAAIAIQNSATQSGAGNIQANYIGQFLTDAPLGYQDSIAAIAPGYATNNTVVDVHAGGLTYIPRLNLTGDGVVAGRVFGYPGNRPLYGAIVRICPIILPACSNSNASTNGSGYFWVVASAGLDTMNISLPGFSSNGTALDLVVHSDTWYWAGDFVLSAYATVEGTLLGNPSGSPLAKANASACSALALPGQPAGPCFETASTDLFGRFVLSVAAGSYILNLSDAGYNTSYLPVDLRAGELVNVGTIFLQQFGTITGTLYGADTDAPVAGGVVQACPLWPGGNCTPTLAAGPNGQYRLSGAPGAYVVAATAPGYENGYADAQMVAGINAIVVPIYLIPSGTNTLYHLSGRVIGGPGLAPLAGAVVSAGTDYATATNRDGNFTLAVPWGSYFVSAAVNGYATQGRMYSVHSNLSGIDFVLSQAIFTVSGTTHDGLTGQAINDVEILVGGSLLATTDLSGAYSFTLPNGTYTLVAEPSVSTSLAPVSFALSISGGNVARNIELFPALAHVVGLVVNEYTGAPLENVSITVTGATVDNIPQSSGYQTTATGGFDAPVYAGHYTIVASLPGYVGAQASVSPTASGSLSVTLSLRPISTPAVAGNGGGGTPVTPLLLLGALAVVGVATYVTLGRWRTETPASGRTVAAGRGGTP